MRGLADSFFSLQELNASCFFLQLPLDSVDRNWRTLFVSSLAEKKLRVVFMYSESIGTIIHVVAAIASDRGRMSVGAAGVGMALSQKFLKQGRTSYIPTVLLPDARWVALAIGHTSTIRFSCDEAKDQFGEAKGDIGTGIAAYAVESVRVHSHPRAFSGALVCLSEADRTTQKRVVTESLTAKKLPLPWAHPSDLWNQTSKLSSAASVFFQVS